jgi:hypothetical protein
MFYYCISPKEGLFDRLQFIVGQIFGIDAIASQTIARIETNRGCSKTSAFGSD